MLVRKRKAIFFGLIGFGLARAASRNSALSSSSSTKISAVDGGGAVVVLLFVGRRVLMVDLIAVSTGLEVVFLTEVLVVVLVLVRVVWKGLASPVVVIIIQGEEVGPPFVVVVMVKMRARGKQRRRAPRRDIGDGESSSMVLFHPIHSTVERERER